MAHTTLNSPADWKTTVTAHLAEHGVSRYAFVRACAAHDLCSAHTAECLLAAPDTVTGQRMPSLETAIEMARLAGLDIVLVPARAPSRAPTEVTA